MFFWKNEHIFNFNETAFSVVYNLIATSKPVFFSFMLVITLTMAAFNESFGILPHNLTPELEVK